MTKQRLAWGSGVGAVLALVLGGVAACGGEFGGDCRETRTCPLPDDTAAGAGLGGASESSAGATTDFAGGAAGESLGGAAGGEMLAGAGGQVDCHVADNCPNDPPTVLAVTPLNEAVEVEPSAEIVITLSEPLDEASVNATNVRILDRGVPVTGQLSYADSVVTFKPDKPLALLAAYEVELSTEVTDAEGAGLAEAFSSSFAVRDGAWSVATVVPGVISAAPHELQLNGDGQALLAWIATDQAGCAATARWYDRGKALGQPKPLTFKHKHFCADAHSAVAANGLALVSWYEEDDNQTPVVATAEFRDGQWGAAAKLSSRFDNANGGAAVSENGRLHYFGTGSDVQVWRSDAQGVWPAQGKPLAPFLAVTGVRTAFAGDGNGVAAWLDADASSRDRVVVSSYSETTATWSEAVVLPGSLSSANAADRGAPAVAFDSAGKPMIVWQRGAELVASRPDASGSWGTYTKVAGSLPKLEREAAGLVFDGQTFVVAYQASDGVTNVVRYDSATGAWGTPSAMHSAAAKAAPRMPHLTADAHGNLLLVWAVKVETGVYSLAYQRFDATAGRWLGDKPIESVTITNAYFDPYFGRTPMGGSANGLAALAVSDLTDSARNLRLVSFY